MKTMTIPEFHAALKEQGVEAREDLAFKCPLCGTIQSARSLIGAGAGKTMDEVERFLAFSCVGRFNNAGPHKKGAPAGKGCDWTLGGFFRLHCLEIIDEDGKAHPRFEIASPAEAVELAQRNLVVPA
ncbi:hypothetical protein C8D77_111153 [Mesorhizobium loti]|uniref:Uncharacterized protein n=1 Tax=Rhizobium loti TaxID=381 RepID=A0A8E2WBC8_RHILI|nr:VVA0879 family protein [Mesorhizobium loti]PWJ88430.1 hypothetical protein C8D77_111153 [Mesorhizobium loti]